MLEPERTEGNQRFYSDSELRKLLNLVFLYNRGYKPSKIAYFSNEELYSIIEHEWENSREEADFFKLVMAVNEFNESKFHKQIDTHIKKHGFRKTITELIIPFLEKIGIHWQTGSISPAQEHFASSLIRQTIISKT